MAGQKLELTLIGGFTARIGSREVFENQTASRNFLSYLALAPKMTETRSKLATFLWENSDETRSRRNLRQQLFRIRSELGTDWPGLIIQRETVGLDPKYVKSDAAEINNTLRAGHVPESILRVPKIHERLLEQSNFRGEISASWVHLIRRTMENQLHSELERIMLTGDQSEIVRAARALLILDPADEAAACELMEIYWRRGENGRALRVYSDLWDHLDREFEIEPGAVAQDLVARIKMSSPENPQQAADRVPDNSKSLKAEILVDAADLSGLTPEARAMAGLFRSDVISNLLKFRQFQVIDANVQKERSDYRLGVSFGQSNGGLRMTAKLVRQNDGVVVWSEGYDDLQTAWWARQISLAEDLAAACATSVSAARLAEIEQRSFAQDAFDKWLQGQSLMLGFRLENLADAEACFSDCIRMAPNSSFGFSALSQLYNGQHLRSPLVPPVKETFVRSKSLANKAIALDPLDSRAHLCRAWASCLLREYGQAQSSFSLALHCNRFDPWTVISSALGEAFSGHDDLAAELIAQFRERRWIPIPQHWGYIATIRFLQNDFRGCIEASERSEHVIQNVLGWQAAAYWHIGSQQSARDCWSEFRQFLQRENTGNSILTDTQIQEWFLTCFPIRSQQAIDRLAQGIKGAAR